MAKKNEKVATLEAKVLELTQAAFDASANAKKAEVQALENGKLMVGLMLYVRDAYVKTLTPQIIKDSPFGQVVIDVLARLEEKSPSTRCVKCEGAGVIDVRGTWGICFGCVCGRILGKPGFMTVIDRKVHAVHEEQSRKNRENRFNRYAPSQEEIDAAMKAKAEKAKASSAADDFGL